MAKTDPDVPMVRKDLTDEQVEERSKVLASRIVERMKLEEKKRDADKKWAAQLKLLEEQIDTLGREVHERASMVPSQLEMGRDPDEPPPIPGVEASSSARKKRVRGSKKSAPRKKKATRANGIAASP